MAHITNEVVYHLGETYTGVIATPQLVGRAEILAQVLAEINRKDRSAIVYLVGPGGVGKTRLLTHLLRLAAQDASLMVAKELIDLYHVRNRSVGGLIQSLLDMVDPIQRLVKERPQDTKVDDKLDELSRAEQEGLSTAELIGRREELTKTLLDLVNQLTRKKRLVLALDTAERLFVTPDLAQQRLGLSQHRPAILQWLLNEFLPKLENTVILVAGRPEPLNLTNELQEIAQKFDRYFVPLTIKGLTETEALAYFESVIQRAETSGSDSDYQAATAIRGWSDAERRTIFHCLHDSETEPRIRPILLALAIDHLIVAGRPLGALVRPLAEAKALSDLERRAIEEELGKALVQNLHEYRRPADDIILTLGWLRKGADIPLLSELTELEEGEVESALARIRDLSFVKIRPADRRLFLHDEMYDLLQRYPLRRRLPAGRERIFKTLQKFYEAQIETARAQIEGLYRPQADTYQETLPDPLAVRDARARLQDAVVEDFYYRLQWHPVDAFNKYIIYTTEALVSGDESLWLLLRAEMFGFLAERDPQEQQEEIEGLRRADVVADSAVRWVIWLRSQERYLDAFKIAEMLHENARDLIEPGGELAIAHLEAWRGIVNTNVGNYDLAEQSFDAALSRLANWGKSNPRTIRWAGLYARAYNGIGYLYSRQTRHYEAIEALGKAVQYWQAVKLTTEEASSQNNRSYDMAKIGKFHVAIPLAKNALRLREQLGPRVPVGLSVNTLALIELGQYDIAGAMRDAQRAYEVFKRLNSFRGMGLALTALAEAKRRNALSVTPLQQGRSAELLADALLDIQQAVEIFSVKIEEPSRKTEALREQGRIFRDWAKLRRERPNIVSTSEAKTSKATVEQLAQQSEAAFREAIGLAQNNRYLLNDIKLSLVKLYFYTQLYVGAPDFVQTQLALEKDLLAEIEAAIPAEYRIPPQVGSTRSKVWSLVQAGGLALFRGLIAFNRWYGNQRDEQWLNKAVEQYTIALANYHYFSDDIFQEVREASDQIYDQLSLLPANQKQALRGIVAGVEQKYELGVGESRMTQFLHNRFGDPALDLAGLEL